MFGRKLGYMCWFRLSHLWLFMTLGSNIVHLVHLEDEDRVRHARTEKSQVYEQATLRLARSAHVERYVQQFIRKFSVNKKNKNIGYVIDSRTKDRSPQRWSSTGQPNLPHNATRKLFAKFSHTVIKGKSQKIVNWGFGV
jgi:hypothetical protein